VESLRCICDFGWKARDFALEGTDGKTYSLADVARRIIACLKPSATRMVKILIRGSASRN
jgi:hypothetical protein